MGYECKAFNVARSAMNRWASIRGSVPGPRGRRGQCALAQGAVVLLVVLFLAGCGGRSGQVPAKGIVLFKGQPLKNANVLLVPVGGGRPASGRTGDDGTFTLGTYMAGDGAMPGAYRVGITVVPDSTDNAPADPDNPVAPETVKSSIPEKYAAPDTSELTATVAKGQEIRIEIP